MPRRRALSDFARDVEAVADALGVDRFLALGVSAGGPYALATARALGDRVWRVGVCSSLSPLCAPHRTPGMALRIRLALASLAAAPRLCSGLGDGLVPIVRRHPELLHRVIAAHAAPGERARLRDPAERQAASSSFLDATAYGVGGMVDDYGTYARGWGFDPAEVRSEVHIWHGANDPLVPVEHALQLAVSLPRCRVFVDADEGHHFFRRRLEDILATLVGRPHPAGLIDLQTVQEVET